MGLALVKDLREFRATPSEQDLEDFETDTLAGLVLARASAGLADGTIHGDVGHLEQIRTWFGRPLWEMHPLTLTTTSAGCCATPPRAPPWAGLRR